MSKKPIVRRILNVTLITVAALILLYAVFDVVCFAAGCIRAAVEDFTAPADYETRDIAEYGKYVGNSEEYMQEYIGAFFR